MFVKKLLILILLIFPISSSELRSKISDYDSSCLIRNYQYQLEYLYSSNEKFSSLNVEKKVVYSTSLGKLDDYNKIRWSLIEIKNESGQYYLKSSYYGDYLCAKSNLDGAFRSKRKVIRVKNDKTISLMMNKCQWKIKKVDLKRTVNKYLIMNAFYDEPLYAVANFLPTKVEKREIYLSNKKDFILENFKWIIECQTG
jgi:hypothetical protein